MSANQVTDETKSEVQMTDETKSEVTALKEDVQKMTPEMENEIDKKESEGKEKEEHKEKQIEEGSEKVEEVKTLDNHVDPEAKENQVDTKQEQHTSNTETGACNQAPDVKHSEAQKQIEGKCIDKQPQPPLGEPPKFLGCGFCRACYEDASELAA